MRDATPEKILLEIKQKVDTLERMVSLFGHIKAIFPGMNFPIPAMYPAELGFLRTVGWLYALYYETGKASVNYFIEMMTTLAIGRYEESKEHFLIIPILRTYLQHNLDPTNHADLTTARHAANWLRNKCGTSCPIHDSDWESALKCILLDGLAFLDSCTNVLRVIENDENSTDMLDDWKVKVERFHPAFTFDSLISEVANDIGFSQIDVVKIRNMNLQKWQNRLGLLKFPYDFQIEARKLIEDTLLSDEYFILPITGKDVMEHFNLPPGPAIGDLLKTARKIQKNVPMDRENLLKELEKSQNIDSMGRIN